MENIKWKKNTKPSLNPNLINKIIFNLNVIAYQILKAGFECMQIP